jgi:hypothetical protein
MAKSVDDRGRGARLARRDEGAYCWYVTEPQRSQPGCIGREGDRLSHSRALRQAGGCRGELLESTRGSVADQLVFGVFVGGRDPLLGELGRVAPE